MSANKCCVVQSRNSPAKRSAMLESLNIKFQKHWNKGGGKLSDNEQKAANAFVVAKLYQRSRSKFSDSSSCQKMRTTSSSSTVKRAMLFPSGNTYLEPETDDKVPDCDFTATQLARCETLLPNKYVNSSDLFVDHEPSDIENGHIALKGNKFINSNEKIENVIVHVNRNNEDAEMMTLINNFRIDIPICTLQPQPVTTTHLDDVCGLGEVETTNTWGISLLPNRQLRLEMEKYCFHLRLAKNPVFNEGNITVEGCLVPGGHFFRLTFAIDVSDEEIAKWLTINDNRYICNESVLDYMIRYPYGALDFIRSNLRILFVDNPACIETSLIMGEKFECYYYKRHFYYKAIDRDFVGLLKIEKWGARSDICAIFLTSADQSGFLVGISSDMAWHRLWRATLYADLHDMKHFWEIIPNVMPSKVEILALSLLNDNKNKYITAKCVFSSHRRIFSSVTLPPTKNCIKSHRIVVRPRTDKRDYDFIISGSLVTSKESVDLKVRVLIDEKLADWESFIAIPLTDICTLIDLLTAELNVRKRVLYNTANDTPIDLCFKKLDKFITTLPKTGVDLLSQTLKYVGVHRLQDLVLTSLGSLYHPLLSLNEALMLIEKSDKEFALEKVCGKEKASLIRAIQSNIANPHNKLDDRKHNLVTPQSTNTIWRKLVTHFLRLEDDEEIEHTYLIHNLVRYFDTTCDFSSGKMLS